MKKDYTHTTFVLDNSGSMVGLIPETITGYNSFIKKQKEDPGSMTFSLYQFLSDTREGPEVEVPVTEWVSPLWVNSVLNVSTNANVWVQPTSTLKTRLEKKHLAVKTTYEFVDIHEVPNLNKSNYVCDTYTPLLDAIGYAMDKTGERLAALLEKDRPSKVIVVILTDGQENASLKYKVENIKQTITHQTEAYKWEFIFLGANIDAVKTGTSFGIAAGSSVNYTTTSASVGSTYDVVSDAVSLAKTGVSIKSFLDNDTLRREVLAGTYTSPSTAESKTGITKDDGQEASAKTGTN